MMEGSKIKLNVQFFSGGFDRQQVDFYALREKLDWLMAHFALTRVVIGWSQDEALYDQIGGYLRGKGVKLLLWLPVFSELGYFQEFQPVLDYTGTPVKQQSLQEGENFEFYCPVDSRNREAIREIFDRRFAKLPIDGVFLDKIRYPSFSNGINGVFSCFCPSCVRRMTEEGIDIDALKGVIEAMDLDPVTQKAGNPGIIKNYRDLTYQFENRHISDFFRFKQHRITEAVSGLSQHLCNLGLEVGLDTFAPHLSGFVGQDIKALMDWGAYVKPMYYRQTWAPAGMPYETGLMAAVFTYVGEDSLLKECMEASLHGKTFPREFVEGELRELRGIPQYDKLHFGFEVNRKAHIAPVDPHYVEDSVTLFCEAGAKGLSLSWDMMDAPQENLMAAEARLIRDGR